MPKTTRTGTPEKMKFDSGFLSDTGALLNDDRLDPALRSYMDKGDSVFSGEEDREDVSEGVRNTLLARMRDENRISLEETNTMAREHTAFTERELKPRIALAKAKVRASNLAVAEYFLAKSRISPMDAEGSLQAVNNLMQGITPPLPQDNIPFNAVDQDNGELNIDNGDQIPENQEGNELQEQQAAVPGQEEPLFAATDDAALRQRDLRKLDSIRVEVETNTHTRRGGLKKFFTAVDRRRKSAESSMNAALRDVSIISDEIRETARRWDRKREAYRNTTFRKRYKSYDRLAQIYYMMTRRLDRNTRSIGEVLDANGGGDAKKKIAEYNGVYSMDALERIINNLRRNPYSASPVITPVKNKQLGEGSLNTEEAARPVKYHQVMTFEAYADGIKTLTDYRENNKKKIRMKLLSDFRGYRAKNQFTSKTNTALTDSGQTRQERGKMTRQELDANIQARANPNPPQNVPVPEPLGMDAAEMNLIIDEKGTNNSFLVSESSAKIYKARVKNAFGQNVKGMYVEGEFFSDDYTAMQNMSQSSFIGSPTWDNAGQEEAVRIAIRRSDFFRHINAGTIQYYASYDASNIAELGDIRSKYNPAPEQGQGENGNPQQNDNAQNENPQQPDEAMSAVILLNAYIDSRNGGVNGQDAPGPDALINQLRQALHVLASSGLSKESKRDLGTLLLAEDDTALWELARDYAERLGGRFSHRLKGLPATGELMRIGLLQEFADPREFDWTDIGKSLRPDKLNMHIEDLSAKRDGFFSLTNLRQSFWDGSLLGTLSGSFSAVTADVGAMKIGGDINYACNMFTKNYGEVAADASTNWGIALAPIPAIITATTGGIQKVEDDKGEYSYEPSEAAKTSLSIIGTIQSALSFVEHIASLVEEIKNAAKAKSNGESIWPYVGSIFKLIIDMIGDLIDIVYWWLDTPLIKGVVKLFGVVKNVVAIVKGIIDSIKTSMEVSRIKSTESDIETAMTQYAARKNTVLQNGQAQNVTEDDMENTQQKIGLAASNNSQGQYFLSLAKSRARRARKMAISSIITNSIDATGNFLGAASALSWFNPIALPFKIATKVSAFIGWAVGKIHDSGHFSENVAKALGNSKFASYSGFNSALKRETGINNKHYLVDLARIFMAIDTHHLIRKPGKTDGETALAINLMQPYLSLAGAGDERFQGGNLTRNKALLQRVPLPKILAAVGAPSNWRAVLRSSIA